MCRMSSGVPVDQERIRFGYLDTEDRAKPYQHYFSLIYLIYLTPNGVATSISLDVFLYSAVFPFFIVIVTGLSPVHPLDSILSDSSISYCLTDSQTHRRKRRPETDIYDSFVRDTKQFACDCHFLFSDLTMHDFY